VKRLTGCPGEIRFAPLNYVDVELRIPNVEKATELLGFDAYFRFTSEHPALYRIIRQAEFVSPEMLHYHYEKLAEGYVEGLRESMANGDVGPIDPEVSAWALMAAGEMLGMRFILWGDGSVPPHVEAELARIIRSVLEPPQ